ERDPTMLYPELAELGWTAGRIDGEPGEVRLKLGPAGRPSASAFASPASCDDPRRKVDSDPAFACGCGEPPLAGFHPVSLFRRRSRVPQRGVDRAPRPVWRDAGRRPGV